MILQEGSHTIGLLSIQTDKYEIKLHNSIVSYKLYPETLEWYLHIFFICSLWQITALISLIIKLGVLTKCKNKKWLQLPFLGMLNLFWKGNKIRGSFCRCFFNICPMLFNFVCQINATTEQAKVFSRSSFNNYSQSRWRCLDLIDISCGLGKLNKGYTVPYSFKMGQHFWGPKRMF